MNVNIVVLPGDGIGPEVTAEGVRVLHAVAARFGHAFALSEALIGGAAIDRTGTALPAETLAACRAADAVLLGAVGGPQWDHPDAPARPEQGLLAIRKALDLFANLRPVSVHPRLTASSPLRPERLAGVEMLVVRELTGGIYFGERGRKQLAGSEEFVFDTLAYSEREVGRLVRVAATLARTRRKTLTSVDKANVLETSRLWRRVATRVVAEEFPDIELEHILVDACAMHLLRRPADFDVIMTENMFGDILTDEASMLAGSLGLLPSASLGVETGGATRMGLYEPIHGSAPDIAGRGIANPLAAILSVAMLLRFSLRLEAEARAVDAAVAAAVDAGFVTGDIAAPGETPRSTEEVGRAVAERVAAG
ncbi:MAG TPA: 3-isopropylmalate dehydrogenase [Armatimonadota bacterium]|nr:3-isopropylmalate dehydrogenase [Armatimonadota bacterium]HOS42338.1 3-isopropylmalate dehydrogenase [Armatimonadota bacterium]